MPATTSNNEYPDNFYIGTRRTVKNLIAYASLHNITFTHSRGKYNLIFPNRHTVEAKYIQEAYSLIFNFLVDTFEKQKIAIQNTRVNQLASFAQECGLDLESVPLNNTLAEDEEALGRALITLADNARNKAVLTASLGGFCGHSARVSKKLQRRANRFISLLNETTTPNTRRPKSA